MVHATEIFFNRVYPHPPNRTDLTKRYFCRYYTYSRYYIYCNVLLASERIHFIKNKWRHLVHVLVLGLSSSISGIAVPTYIYVRRLNPTKKYKKNFWKIIFHKNDFNLIGQVSENQRWPLESESLMSHTKMMSNRNADRPFLKKSEMKFKMKTDFG